jgi:HTH-type transcriptional regulator/antitoxin HigA
MLDSPIILNEREARRARTVLARAKELLSAKETLNSARDGVPPNIVKMHQKAITSSRNALSAMLEAYDRIRSGDYTDVAKKWDSEPGIVLIVARIARNLSQSDLASKLGMREQQIQRYEAERYRSISLQNFRRVAAALGVQLKASIGSEFQAWVSQFSVPEQPGISEHQLQTIVAHATKHNWFDVPHDEAEQYRAIIDFIHESHVRFGSPGLLRTGLKSLDLRNDALLAAWRAQVLARAEKMVEEAQPSFDPYDISWLTELVRLSKHDDGPARAVKLAAQKGIFVVAEAQLIGLKLDGAAFLSGGVPVIGVTVRHDRVDNFWYTLLHECGHVFLHYQSGLAAGFFDEDLEKEKTDELELEADQFASSMLIPSEQWRTSPARISKSAQPIEQFARELGIHPAIVFGRIRKERNDYRIFSDRIGLGKVRNQLLTN